MEAYVAAYFTCPPTVSAPTAQPLLPYLFAYPTFPQSCCLLHKISPRLIPRSVPHLFYKLQATSLESVATHVMLVWLLHTQFCYLKPRPAHDGQITVLRIMNTTASKAAPVAYLITYLFS